MSPSQQRSVSVGNITDCDLTQPLCETRVPTHVSCGHLDRRHVSRVPPAPPPRLSSLQRAPSQALMYYTTVPQSLVTRNLGSRHQPTRSSLRHSRMLVLLREGRVPRKYLPGVLSRSQRGVVLCVAQVVLGCLLIILALLRIAIQEHMLMSRDWPLYSGVPVLCSGSVGLWLVCCCRYYYPPYSNTQGFCIFPITTYSLISSLLVSLVSSVYSLVTSISHILHLITLTSSTCAPPIKMPSSWPSHAGCLCLSSSHPLWQQGELVYPGTSCLDLQTFQPPLLVSLIILNVISMVTSLSFMLLLACSKHNITFRNWRNIKKFEMSHHSAGRRNVRW